jgi:ubiquinone/menaquinone biosynthesis C-methylase UbiE
MKTTKESFDVEKVKSLSLLRGDPQEIKTVNDPFDRNYARLFDTVFDVEPLFEYEITQIKAITKPDKNSRVLDAGCGVGRHLQHILAMFKDAKVEAVDQSYQMIRRAMIRNPSAEFTTASLLGSGLYRPLSLTHILALHDTLCSNNATELSQVLTNFHRWLQLQGYLVLHILDPNKLDPGPREFSQYFKGDDDARHALTYFEAFTHEAWFEKVKDKPDTYRYCEQFLFPEGMKKISTREMWVPPTNQVLKMVTDMGFKLVEVVDLMSVGVKDFNMYIFRKEK